MATRDELRLYAKFRATCRCGARSPRFASDVATGYWMSAHEAGHRASGKPAATKTLKGNR